MAGASTVVATLAGLPLRAFGRAPLLEEASAVESDRILVLIQLAGGNDGLNTIIPYENDIYYEKRPTIAISKQDVLPISTGYGFHPSLDALLPFWAEGRMSIVRSVGYPEPSLSHFRSTDIWTSATDASTQVATGWAARALSAGEPYGASAPPRTPVAVQIGTSGGMLFEGAGGAVGVTISTPEEFYRLAGSGAVYGDITSATSSGRELAFLRKTANDSLQYSHAIKTAADAGRNTAAYPTYGPLAAQLAIAARLIKGGLGARIYLVSLAGFDTHADQLGQHAFLLRQLAEGVAAFYSDLAEAGLARQVLAMTFSEFGRRVEENGSGGTDHGAAAPLMLFGEALTGGFVGRAPDLGSRDKVGNLKLTTDFRAVYAAVLQQWLGMEEQSVTQVLGHPFEPLLLIPHQGGTATGVPPEPSTDFTLEPNYPNPFHAETRLAYHVPVPMQVRLVLYDAAGRRVQLLEETYASAGRHTLTFHAGHLPSGTYFCRMETSGGTQVQKMILAR